MKKLILWVAIVAFASQVQAQKRKKPAAAKPIIPAVVTTTFKGGHPGQTDVKWKKTGTHYEASYHNVSKKEVHITYDGSGNFVGMKEEMVGANIPVNMIAYIKKNFGEDQSLKAYKVSDAKGTITYQAGIKDNHLTFDSKGNFVKTEKPVKKRKAS